MDFMVSPVYIQGNAKESVWGIKNNLFYIFKDWNMFICNKCRNEHNDQCMGQVGMSDYWPECLGRGY